MRMSGRRKTQVVRMVAISTACAAILLVILALNQPSSNGTLAAIRPVQPGANLGLGPRGLAGSGGPGTPVMVPAGDVEMTIPYDPKLFPSNLQAGETIDIIISCSDHTVGY